MATRTISNTGGNYNAVGTWVEGIVPTSADDVVSTATSGPLTINVSSAARSFDLTTYTNTLTLSTTWTISGTGLTMTFGAGMSFLPGTSATARIVINNTNTIAQYTTSRIPGLRFGTNATKTLATDIYCIHFGSTGQSVVNGNTLYSSGNFGDDSTTLSASILGTTKYVLDGSGVISVNMATEMEINTTGTYSTNYVGINLFTNSSSAPFPKLTIIAGNLNTNSFNVSINKGALVSANVTISSDIKIPNLSFNILTVNSSYRPMNITLLKTLIVENIFTLSTSRFGTTDNATPQINIYGYGLSASNIILNPIFRSTSSTSVFEYTYKAADLRLCSGVTHSIGNLIAIGGFTTDKATISSTTASSPCTLQLGSKEGSQIINYNFTDVNASSGAQVVAINATVSNCTNVTNVYPTGGTPSGGGGGAWTFIN